MGRGKRKAERNAGEEDRANISLRRVRAVRGTGSATAEWVEAASSENPVIYWMSREQRVRHNWALLYAAESASRAGVPLCVAFCLTRDFLGAPLRHYQFMLEGLAEIPAALAPLNIHFKLLHGSAPQSLPPFAREVGACLIVTDFSPLRISKQWRSAVSEALMEPCIPVHEVDAHNVVPAWIASPKREYSARTIRPKLWSASQEFLVAYPELWKQKQWPAKVAFEPDTSISVEEEVAWLGDALDTSVAPVRWLASGEKAAYKHFQRWLGSAKFKQYDEKRNHPWEPGFQSGISPYLHYGQISAQYVISEALAKRKGANAKMSNAVDKFVEETFIRRELSDNFCYHTEDYDKVTGALEWAQNTLKAHEDDKRTHLYTEQQLEAGKTHDELWNAAQLELVHKGKMHGYMRMYWAKKLLEWTPNAQEALRIAIRQNDRFSLDGRNPNGYVGCMWSICGVHDRGWTERAVFGKIRYMNYDGCKRKFKAAGIAAYVAQAKKWVPK